MDHYMANTNHTSVSGQTINYQPIGLGMIDSLQVESAAQIMDSNLEDIVSLWGPFIYQGMITQINGVAGTGKSTLLYNIAVKAAWGGDFAGIHFPRRLNVLYADLETARVLRKMKLGRILQYISAPDNLSFIGDIKFPKDLEKTRRFITDHNIDLFIVDTRNEVFDTEDEDNNSEAQQQYECFKYLRDETGVAIIEVGHIGKSGKESKPHGVYAGRGASSRACSVDVVCNLSEDSEGILCLSKEKDRVYGGNEKLHLKKVGQDAFEVVEKEDAVDARQGEKAKLFCLKVINGDTTTSDLLSQALSEGISEATLYRTLAQLTKDGLLEKPQKGVYRVKTEAPAQLSINPFLRDDSLIVDNQPEVAR